MRVCDQFTDARIARFFPPLNHELEVHSSVDITGTPTVTDLGLELPVIVIGSADGSPRGVNPLSITDGVGLAQGEKVVGLQSFRSVSDAKRAPSYLNPDEMDIFGDDLGVAPESLSGLTHAIVELDWMVGPRQTHKLVKDSPFDGQEAIVLPIGEPIPHIDEAFEDSEAFIVKGFVNKAGEMVTWNVMVRWLIDMCIMNTYAHNRVESSLLRNALGGEAALMGLVSVNEDVAAYLKHFDGDALDRRRDGLTFTPTSEPTFLGHDRKFPPLNRREKARLHKLINVSDRAMATPDRSQLK